MQCSLIFHPKYIVKRRSKVINKKKEKLNRITQTERGRRAQKKGRRNDRHKERRPYIDRVPYFY